MRMENDFDYAIAMTKAILPLPNTRTWSGIHPIQADMRFARAPHHQNPEFHPTQNRRLAFKPSSEARPSLPDMSTATRAMCDFETFDPDDSGVCIAPMLVVPRIGVGSQKPGGCSGRPLRQLGVQNGHSVWRLETSANCARLCAIFAPTGCATARSSMISSRGRGSVCARNGSPAGRATTPTPIEARLSPRGRPANSARICRRKRPRTGRRRQDPPGESPSAP